MNVTWNGASGTLYTTELCQFARTFKPIPGLYLSRTFCETESLRPNLGGRDGQFNDRLKVNLANHHQWDRIRRHGATNVCVMYVGGGKAARISIETDLRIGLDPPAIASDSRLVTMVPA
jgi:hypothetical protein